MLERQQSTQEQARQVMADGGVVIYWRPGCPFCERLDSKLGELGDHATWVNIWEDPQAEEHVHFVVADVKSRNQAAQLIRNAMEGAVQ